MGEKYVKLEDVNALIWQVAGCNFDGEAKINDANELIRQLGKLPVAKNIAEVTFCEKCKYRGEASEALPWRRDKYVICKVHNMYKKMTDFCSDGAEEDGDG